MNNVLVTGATGNVGTHLINALAAYSRNAQTIAAVRNIEKSQKHFEGFSHLDYRIFDFGDVDTFRDALKGIDYLFLLRPPQLADVDRYFKPLLSEAQKQNIKNIVFLSVQGVEQSKIIPHNKIERLIKGMGFDFIFIRPSYFMQNLTTTLLPEINKQNRLTLPSGNARFNWIDVNNIGRVGAELIINFDKYVGKGYDITGNENLTFAEVIDIINHTTRRKINYKSINPISFYFKKRQEGLKHNFVLVMTLLHFLPRIQKEPLISD